MSKRSRRNAAGGISLFPFLAVLICTMGALIVLLVIVVQQARVHAKTVSEQHAPEQAPSEPDPRQIALEDQNWRAEVLQQQRAEIQGELADKRLELSHLEEHVRQLEKKWRQLQSQAMQLERVQHNEQFDQVELEARLTEARQRVAQLQQALETARQQAEARRHTFTIIPYPGPHGTTRRPIYVECTARGVILQPENVVLRPDDFAGSLGPGNPLDAALRAAREYYARYDVPGTRNEPYPLLIIRPQGVAAYSVAREAMSDWEDEFGYELVSDELDLNFPAPDPVLAGLLQKAIEDARQRQQALRRAIPTAPRASGFVVSEARGGVVPIDAPPDTGSGHGAGSGRSHTGVGQGRGGMGTGRGEARGDKAPSSDRGSDTANDYTTSQPGAARVKPGSNGQAGGGDGGGRAPSIDFPTMARTRGNDWALKDKTEHATGYRRPVRIICEADRLVLTPAAGTDDSVQTFDLQKDEMQAIDEFVQALHARMDRWGLAPLGGYWRPQLKVTVAPHADARFQMFQQLLQDSGLEIIRDNP